MNIRFEKLSIIGPLLLFTASGEALASDFNGIATAKDGDSLVVGSQEVRLFGIDAPEYKQTCSIRSSNWACGSEAASNMRALVNGRSLRCSAVDRDVYGRTVAICHLGAIDIGSEMVKRGLATVLPNGVSRYGAVEAASRANRTGIWASSFEKPSDYRASHRRPDAVSSDGKGGRPALSSRARPGNGMWRNCADARAAGAAPVYRGTPGYNPNLDGDHDGIACEPYRQRR